MTRSALLASIAFAGAVATAAPLTALGDPVPAGPPAPPAPITAPAPVPSFELRDRGDAVEIIAHNIKAARTAIIPIRSRLEVPIVGSPSAKRVTPGDSTVKVIELDSDGVTRALSVKLGFERDDVKALSRFAQAIQVGDDLHMLVPRKLPSDGVAKLPGPTLPPALAAAVAQIDQVAEQAAPPPRLAKPAGPPAPPVAEPVLVGPPAPPPAPAAKPAAVEPRPDEAAPARPVAKAKSLSQTLAPEPADAWSKITMYGALGLAAAGAGVWWMRRRRGVIPAVASIDVIAQRSLGGKARIVWLSAGPRELIIAVTAQQVRLLGQWPKGDDAAAAAVPATTGPLATPLPAAQTFADAHADFRDVTATRPVSPAVSGILRLRGRTGQMPAVSDVVATGDIEADELWAREILAATGSRQ